MNTNNTSMIRSPRGKNDLIFMGRVMGKVVSVLNMKGGVGKTTISAHVFRNFYFRRRKNVLLIDMDAQFNLTQAVIGRDQYEELVDEQRTILRCFEPAPADDFFKVKKSDSPPPDSTEIAKTLKRIKGGIPCRIDLIVGDFTLVKYSLIDDPQQLNVASTFFKRFINECKKRYDLIVLDCNPSSSFVTKCALENSDAILSPVRPDRYSVLGIELVNKLLAHLKIAPPHYTVINGVQRGSSPSSAEAELRAHPIYGPNVLYERLVYSRLLAADPQYTGFATDKKVSWSGVLRREINALCDEIGTQLGV
ncbi:MAG: ParA family protein [Marivibrio sp.]|uniref:ParA family protein n=1 Tax=Marivibrio sp. TaxID=2039719 RepID=UPI0032F07334